MTNGLEVRLLAALNKLCKWRLVFAGWQLGTRSIADPESQAVRDHREVTILLRTEVNALGAMMMKKGVWTIEEWQAQLLEEAQAMDTAYEKLFPGARTSATGVTFTNINGSLEWMKNWKP